MIIAGTDEAQHDESVRKLLDRARSSGVKFNHQKIQWKVAEVGFMGHVVSADGLKADRENIQAIADMPTPTSKAELQRALGVINYLSLFIPDMSVITTPLRHLLKKDSHWQWQPEQAVAFNNLTQAISSAPVLKFFDPSDHLLCTLTHHQPAWEPVCCRMAGRSHMLHVHCPLLKRTMPKLRKRC